MKIKHTILYFSRSGGSEDIESVKLAFEGKEGTDNTVGGLISTRQAHGVSWAALTTSDTVEGERTLTLPPDDANLKQAFKDELIEDLLFVITYEGMTPEWSV